MHDRGDYKHGWQLERESQETEGKLPFVNTFMTLSTKCLQLACSAENLTQRILLYHTYTLERHTLSSTRLSLKNHLMLLIFGTVRFRCASFAHMHAYKHE